MADSADEREAEHLPRLADAGDAPRDHVVLPDPAARVSPPEDRLDLKAGEVTGPDRRLDGDVVELGGDSDLTADPTPYFRYDPDLGDITPTPPPGTRVEGGLLMVDD